HTWLASHTGPMDSSTKALGARPCPAPPAVRSQKPAPKSAPPNTAYKTTPANRITATDVLTFPAPGLPPGRSGPGRCAPSRCGLGCGRTVGHGDVLPPPPHRSQHIDGRRSHNGVDHQRGAEEQPDVA